MNISYEWLKEFCRTDLTPEELRDLLTARCATVEEIHRLREDLADIVVARVVEAARHPNSERLWLTKVDAGGAEPLSVVCGAPVVTPGTLYPFARVGVTLPGGITLERRKIRGEFSNGMLCSARELALGDDASGIMALDVDVAPGTPLLEALPVGDSRLVIDVLPNRPDLLSHLGVAREVAAATGVAVRMPEIPPAMPAPGAGGPPPDGNIASHGRSAATNSAQGVPSPVTLRVDDTEGAPRYMGVVIRGVAVGPSPDWLVARLRAVGSRSINNVVDATNYMLHGFGQPMHAFDLAKLAGNAVVVRRARLGERLVTLDGVERALGPEMTVIADAERSQAVAGVMGGRDSEVTDSTHDIFLEVAIFDRKRVRRTRRALGLSTDASYRFERGVDYDGALAALELAVQLITAVAGGRAELPAADVASGAPEPRVITLRPDRASHLVGVEVGADEIAHHLSSVGFRVERADDTLRVTAPSWRFDIEREVDLVEEVARLHGYDALPSDIRPYRPTTVPDSPLWILEGRLRDALTSLGLYEARPIPFVAGDDATHVRVANPLAENEAHLRTSVLESLARRVEYNLAHVQRNVRLFELGTAFTPRGAPLPLEEARVGAVLMGDRRPVHFTEPRPPAFDEWDAKGLAEDVACVAWPGQEVALAEPETPSVLAALGEVLWDVSVGGTRRGSVVRLTLDAPVWAAPAFGVELTLTPVESQDVAPHGTAAYAAAPLTAPAVVGRYVPLPTTPAAEFDLALVVRDDVPAASVERVIRSSAGDLLERLTLFDEFRGEGIPPGTRSLAWRLVLRDPQRTLREKEIEGRRQKILRTLESELGIRPRGA